MATRGSDDASQWKTGLLIVAAVLGVGAVLGGAVLVADPGLVPYEEYVAGGVGAVLGFVIVSYALYGR